MKQMKMVIMAMLAVVMGVSFTSCLDSDSSPANYPDYVTVETSYVGGIYLKSDMYGYTYYPTNPDALKYNSGDNKYARRALIRYELAEGEAFAEGKNEYKVKIVYATDLRGNDMSFRPDTITVNPGAPFSSTINGWGANDYLTIGFNAAYHTKLHLDLFDMYPEKAEGSKLYVRLNQNYEMEYASEFAEIALSFRLPSKGELLNFEGLQYLANDSIDIVVRANDTGSKDIESKPIRVKIN